MADASISVAPGGPVRLGHVEGYLEQRNEIIYHPPKHPSAVGCVVFFGGDMQDYKENMLAHRDNKHYANWDLESTAVLLHNHFPAQAILIVKPSKMSLMTFSCYQNFVDVNNFGAPNYEKNLNSIRHLKLLLQNVQSVLQKLNESKTKSLITVKSINLANGPLNLVGFSKGCVVLNQFLYSFHSLQGTDKEQEMFINNISNMYWLESGHSGPSSTFVTDKAVLKSFSDLKISVHIHLTPYQICADKPRIGKEERIFRDNLCKLKMDVSREFHFVSVMFGRSCIHLYIIQNQLKVGV